MFVVFVDPFWEEIRLFEQRFEHQQYQEGSGLPPNAVVVNDPPDVELWLAQLVLDGVVRINHHGTFSSIYQRPYSEGFREDHTDYLSKFIEKCNEAVMKVDRIVSQLPHAYVRITTEHSTLHMYRHHEDILRSLVEANDQYYETVADFEIVLERDSNRMKTLFGVDRSADNFLANERSYTRTFKTHEGQLTVSIGDLGSVKRIEWPERLDRCSSANCRSGKLRHLSIVINSLVDQIDLLVSHFVVSLAHYGPHFTETITVPLNLRDGQHLRPNNRLLVIPSSIDISLSFKPNTPE